MIQAQLIGIAFELIPIMCVIPEGLRVRTRKIMGTLLKKEDLWQITADLPAEEVEVFDASGKLAGVIKIRGLTGSELTKYQESLTIRLSSGQTKPNVKFAMAKLIVLSAINDDGSPYFDTSDTKHLDDAPARILVPLFESAQRLCGLTDEVFKEMVEGFDETPSEDSSSG